MGNIQDIYNLKINEEIGSVTAYINSNIEENKKLSLSIFFNTIYYLKIELNYSLTIKLLNKILKTYEVNNKIYLLAETLYYYYEDKINSETLKDDNELMNWLFFLTYIRKGEIKAVDDNRYIFSMSTLNLLKEELINFVKIKNSINNINYLEIQPSEIIDFLKEIQIIKLKISEIKESMPPGFYEIFSFLPETKNQIELLELFCNKINYLKSIDNNEYITFHSDRYDTFQSLRKECECWPTYCSLKYDNNIINYIMENFNKTVWLKQSVGNKIYSNLEYLKALDHFRKENLAVFFCDLRGYTTITEKLNGTELLKNIIEKFLTKSSEIIEGNLGLVKSYLGDGFMAVFGLDFKVKPSYISNMPNLNAINSIMEIDKYIKNDFKKELELLINIEKYYSQENLSDYEEIISNLSVGFGLDYGEVLFGEIGDDSRKDFTILGDIVNTASRLEGETKEYAGNFLFSSRILKSVNIEDWIIDNRYIVILLRKKQLKGKKEENELYTLININILETKEIKLLKDYNLLIKELYSGANKIVMSDIEILLELLNNKVINEKIKGWDENIEYFVKQFFGKFIESLKQ